MTSKSLISEAISKKIGAIILLSFSILAATVSKIAMAFIFQHIIDSVLPMTPDQNPPLGLWVGFFVLALLTGFVLDLTNHYQATDLGTYVTSSLSKAVYSAGMRAEYGEIQKFQSEELVKKTTGDCEKIGLEYIGKNWTGFLKEIIVLVSLFTAMMIIVPLWGLITFIVLPLFYMAIHGMEKYILRLNLNEEQELQARADRVLESFTKIRGIKLDNGVTREEDEFNRLTDACIKKHQHVATLKNLFDHGLIDLFVGLIIAVILGIGGYLTINSGMEATIGRVASFVIMIPFAYMTFRKLMLVKIRPANIAAELKSLDQVFLLRSEVKSEPIANLEEVLSLKFQNVSYFGNSAEENLEAISFELKRGEKLGILSYEATSRNIMFDLVTKLIRPRDGVISINNCDLNKMNTFFLRDIITAVPQEINLMDDTIANNITYPMAFDEYKYNDALNRSGLKEILATLENKDQTMIDRNSEFTNDFRQRIVLANAFYKDSKIFVLNEATSYLDVRSEEAVMKEFYKLKNKIAIVMSDKVYNVLNCDKVLIISEGRVLEYGKVQELLQNKDSEFNRMIKKVKTTRIAKVS